MNRVRHRILTNIKWIITLVLIWTIPELKAQSILSFNEYEWNFGNIQEDGGKVMHDFHFSNPNEDPIIILGAGTSCGCTKAYFSREPIKKGGSGSIRIEFDPMYSPGVFHQSISIHTNMGSLEQKLSISGNVMERKKSPKERYPLTLIGDARIESNSVNLSTVEHGGEKWAAIGIINLGQKEVSLRLEKRDSDSILETEYPKILEGGQSTTINLGYRLSSNFSQYGPKKDLVDIYIDQTKIRFPITVHAVFTDAFAKADSSPSPFLFISHNFIKFGKWNSSEQPEWYSIKLKNTGEEKLYIRNISSMNGLMDLKPCSKEELRPMESTFLKVRFRYPFPSFGILTDRICITTNEKKEPFKCIKASIIIVEK